MRIKIVLTALLLVAVLLPTIASAIELRADKSQPWIYQDTITHKLRNHQESMTKLRQKTTDKQMIQQGSEHLSLMFVAAVTDSTVGIKFFAQMSDGDEDISLPSDGIEFELRNPDDESVIVKQKSLWVMIPQDRTSHKFWDSRTTRLSLNATRDPDYMERFGVIRLTAAVPDRYVGWDILNIRMVQNEASVVSAAPRRSRTALPPAGLPR